MGVLACDRTCCPNIMCDRLILDRYYICDDCWLELLAYKDTWTLPMSESTMESNIAEFMDSSPKSKQITDIDEAFNKITNNGGFFRE